MLLTNVKGSVAKTSSLYVNWKLRNTRGVETLMETVLMMSTSSAEA
jgi:hypothetical protein